MSSSQHTRDLRTFSHRLIVIRNRPSEKWLQSGRQVWLSKTGGICASFSAGNFERVFSMPSLGASSVAPFRSSTSAVVNVACLAVWVSMRENILLETIDLHPFFRSLRFKRRSRPSKSSLATRFDCVETSLEGERCMKDTVHLAVHPSGHPLIFGRVRSRSSCASGDNQFGRGQNTGLGWSDPTFAHASVPKVIRGVAPAQLRGDRAECFVHVQMGRRTTPNPAWNHPNLQIEPGVEKGSHSHAKRS